MFILTQQKYANILLIYFKKIKFEIIDFRESRFL